ncbi:sugar-binding transcriptional regulator [Isoptericola variabilis]|uniref:Transcriptional regulator, DeoR family n=1 Tax=Isoptericola variabilis (strain 225) TaxID=743718 RepID=F6FW11_ISOV2|nr:sugar-binding transcriptional regulator [Isoptericola variabilis]AEG44481.1 transcriptional regulator, DeoR family [Isoptericola variabilis 225]TWH26606.1 DNA-binding transcriptional regulator LsrR (DeoR family) [Isoptericola variabilis J7]
MATSLTSSTSRRQAAGEQIRLMAKVARMYHERGMRQAEIAAELHVSQPRVSRLLKRATEVGIVRTTVSEPAGVFTDLEQELESRYGLTEAVVVDPGGDDELRALGSAAALHLETTLIGGDSIGISSWSASLLAAVEALRPFSSQVVTDVVQLVGGVGDPRVQVDASRLLTQLATATGAEPIFLPAPGLLGSRRARESLMADSTVLQVSSRWPNLTMAMVGIGALEPSPLLRRSGNSIAEEDQEKLRIAGAVGDVCLRFFDEDGDLVPSDLDDRVIGIEPDALRAIPRRIAVAGGERKIAAIRGALRGRWINVLVTDVRTARALLSE